MSISLELIKSGDHQTIKVQGTIAEESLRHLAQSLMVRAVGNFPVDEFDDVLVDLIKMQLALEGFEDLKVELSANS